jgi:hypothetical protein
MEAEERQRQRVRVKKKVTAEQLESSVPAAPLLADFDLSDAVSTVSPVAEIAESSADLNTAYGKSVAMAGQSQSEDRYEDSLQDELEKAEADYAELGRGLHRLEPHFFLGKVSRAGDL